MDAEELLYLKVRLLLEGATLPEGYSHGRKGGAGPVGGRYFLLPNGRPCGIPIRTGDLAKKFNSSKLELTDGTHWLYDSKYTLIEVPKPDFYQDSNSEGVEYHKIALLHGTDCLATTVVQSCRYWTTGEQCKFCTIPSSYLSGLTILEKTPEQIAEVVEQAEKEGILRHILLTTGTSESADMGIEKLVKISKKIREVSDIPIAVQFEPPEDPAYLGLLADAGVKAVGIHIESADERVRKEICPGKYAYGSMDLYNKIWDVARQHFDKGDVTTFLLYGLGEDIDLTLDFCEDVSARGILPIVTPIRPAPGSQLADSTPSYIGRLAESVEFYKSLGEILYNHDLNPMLTSAGCSKCGGCTPIQEAYDWAATV